MREGKLRAIELRKQGKTYREILLVIPVAKSTLSSWLGSVGLTTRQTQRITKLRKQAQAKGAEARKDKRLREMEDCTTKGRKDIGKLSPRELWLIGIALHWAEGAKQNTRSPSQGVVFGNLDYKMILVFLKWLEILNIKDEDIMFTLYVHETRISESPEFLAWWASMLGIETSKIEKVYKKQGKLNTNRTNTKDLYHGLIRIKVRESTMLNRKIQGWFLGIATSFD